MVSKPYEPYYEDPFAVEAEGGAFLDARLVQIVSDPSRLIFPGEEGEKPRGGFFAEVETGDSPVPGFRPAVLLTRDGRRVRGFGGRELALYPVAARFRWELGEPESRRPVQGYQAGARGHVQILGILPGGAWTVVTARGLASRDLLRAFEEHRRRVARSMRSADGRPYAPFAALLRVAAGQPYRKGSSVVTPLVAVAGELEPAPVEVGRAVRARWAEVQAWMTAWAENGNGNGEEKAAPSEAPELPAAQTPVTAHAEAPEPEPVPEGVPAPEPEEPASGPDLDLQAALAFLIGKAGAIALNRLAAVLGEQPADAGEAVRALAKQKGDAPFWKDVSGALDRFLAWTDRMPVLYRRMPVRYRALKERLRLGPAFGTDSDDPETLAALAALAWLFRGARDREALEALFRRDPDTEQ